jgi:aerobic C4-dicarboxylate transport protein
MKKSKPLYRQLYIQVLFAIAIGILLGHFFPQMAEQLKPLGDGFIALIKMLIAPIIFCTIVVGIASIHETKSVGRIGFKALLYFEIVSTLALLIGLVVVNLLKPGSGFNVDPLTLDKTLVASFESEAHAQTTTEFLLNIIPHTIFSGFVEGNILQILLVSLLFGFALLMVGEKGKPIVNLIDVSSKIFFSMIEMVMKLAPIGAFGAMAFTVGKYSIMSLAPLMKLMGCFYLACLLFIFIVLGSVAKVVGFNIFRFLLYIKEELLIVLGTSSSESVLPRMMEKLERLGCAKPIVSLVIPTGYSFNLDGTNIYLTLAVVFIAQATNIDLTLSQQLMILLVAILTSKGASGVTGAGFITLAATLAVVPTVPVAGIALIFGIDRFMSEARALTNIIGNGVATMVIAKWERGLDQGVMRKELGKCSPD